MHALLLTLLVFVAGALGIGLCWWSGYFILAGGCGVVLLLLGVVRLLGS